MPQCPHCQTPYEPGQRYCSICGSFLLHPEEGDTFCPQCGVRVSSRQEFCHECDAPLKEVGLKKIEPVPGEPLTAGPPPAEPPPAPAPTPAPSGLPPWAIGIMAGAGILVIILLILLFSRSAPPPPVQTPPPELQAPAPPAPAPPPAATAPAPPAEAPAADLKEELQKVLSALREAQLKKDITEFMSLYATSFTGYDQKRQDTLDSWQRYDYSTLVFTVDKVQALDTDNALAWVTWYMDIRNRSNQESVSATQTYQVRFVKEKGNWRIRELKEVQ